MGIHAPAAARNPIYFRTLAILATGYFGGWWFPKPLLGLKTPSWMAESIHLVAAGCCCTALVLAAPTFHR